MSTKPISLQLHGSAQRKSDSVTLIDRDNNTNRRLRTQIQNEEGDNVLGATPSIDNCDIMPNWLDSECSAHPAVDARQTETVPSPQEIDKRVQTNPLQ